MNAPQNVPKTGLPNPGALVERHARPGRTLLAVLHAIQDEAGFVPHAVIAPLARALNLSRAEVYGVLTYYHDFRAQPPATVTVRLCRAEACRSMGSEALAQHIEACTGRRFDLSGARGGERGEDRKGREGHERHEGHERREKHEGREGYDEAQASAHANARATAPATDDDTLALESAYCLGQCALSPALTINGELHAKLTPQKFDALLARTVRATRSGETA